MKSASSCLKLGMVWRVDSNYDYKILGTTNFKHSGKVVLNIFKKNRLLTTQRFDQKAPSVFSILIETLSCQPALLTGTLEQ